MNNDLNKYNKFMNKIEVTEEMRERILSNIKNAQNADIKPQKRSFMQKYGGWIAVAACFALLVALNIATFTGAPQSDIVESAPQTAEVDSGTEDLQVVFDSEEFETLSELEAAFGCEIKIPEALPFEYDSAAYFINWGIAEVEWYLGDESVALYRQKANAEEDENISGNYNVYPYSGTIDINGVTVSISGDSEEKIYLALWSAGDMRCSLDVASGITAEQIGGFIEAG